MPPCNPDNAAWFELHVRPHEPMLRAWLRSRFASEGDIDDVVQETYVRLLKARERGEVSSPKVRPLRHHPNLSERIFPHHET